jgi:hypothetical protein
MACALTKGRQEPCKDSVGGLKTAYFVNFGVQPTFDAGTEEVTDLQADSLGTAITAYKYDLKAPGNNFEEDAVSSRDNGTTFWQQTVNLILKKMTAGDRKELKLLAYGRPHIVLHTNMGDAFIYGLYNGMDVTSIKSTSGGAFGDLYGYTVAMTGMEKLPGHFLMGATVDDPFAGLVTAPTIVAGADDEPG